MVIILPQQKESGCICCMIIFGTMFFNIGEFGASLIASNISATQFIGMSGSGFKMGLAISTNVWLMPRS